LLNELIQRVERGSRKKTWKEIAKKKKKKPSEKN
jgi:hypothetical protein